MLGRKAELWDARLSAGCLSQACRALVSSDTLDRSLNARDLSDLVCKNKERIQTIESREVEARGWG